eukprot:SAG11_NODE_7108_length_1192_cov_1.933211_1_plen_222_part_01
MVRKDIAARTSLGDVPRRLAAAEQLEQDLDDTGFDQFNENLRFCRFNDRILAQLPRCGDLLECFDKLHSRPVLALTCSVSNKGRGCLRPLLVSGGLDGIKCEFSAAGEQSQQLFTNTGRSQQNVPVPVLCVELLESLQMVAVGLFDGRIVLCGLGGSMLRHELVAAGLAAVTSLAWSDDAALLVSGRADHRLVVWSLPTADDFESPQQWELSAYGDTHKDIV